MQYKYCSDLWDMNPGNKFTLQYTVYCQVISERGNKTFSTKKANDYVVCCCDQMCKFAHLLNDLNKVSISKLMEINIILQGDLETHNF